MGNQDPATQSPSSSEPTPFSCFGRLRFGYNIGIAIFAIGAVIGQLGQQVSLPLYLSTFGHYAGAYFVLFFCSLCFVLLFGLGTLVLYCRNQLSREELFLKWQPYFVVVGICDALNGILVVFSAFLGRVSGPLGAIITQSMVPFTLILSKPILGVYYKQRNMKLAIIGAAAVIFAALLSLVPLFVRLHTGEAQAKPQAWWWPLVSITGVLPGAVMNIVQEKFQAVYREEAVAQKYTTKRYSVFLFQFWESLYQFIFFVLFFWMDMLPNFGFSSDLNSFWTAFSNNWKCFLSPSSLPEGYSDRCDYSAPLGLLFIASYFFTYIMNTELTLYASANLGSLIGAVPPAAAVIFWLAFPSVAEWAGADHPEKMDTIFSLLALPIMIIGVLVYKKSGGSEREPDEEDASGSHTGTVELCCTCIPVADESINYTVLP